MSYAYRLKSRVDEEGIYRTFTYIICVGCYCLSKMLTAAFLDLRYSGKLLNGNLRTPYKHLGANDTYHTDYSVMPIIFKNITVSDNDVLVDVGCGKGRVINFWLSKKLKNRIYGLELDPQVSGSTSAQFSRWNNVTIINGDAIENLPTDGTIFYFYNPFSRDKVSQFEKRLSNLNQKVKVIYYRPESIDAFRNDRWDISYINFEKDLGIKRWGRINKYHDLAILTLK